MAAAARRAVAGCALALAACGPRLTAEEGQAVKTITDGVTAAYQAIRMGDRLLSFETPADPATTDVELAAAVEARAHAELPWCGSVARDAANVTIELGTWPGCPLADGTRAGGTLVAMATRSGSYAQMDLVFRRVIAEERALDGTLTFAPLAPRWLVFNGLFVEDVPVAFPGEVKARSGTLTLDIPLSVLRPDSSADGGVVPYTSTLYDVEWADGECYPRSGRVEIGGPAKVTLTFSGSTPSTGKAQATGEQGRTEIDLPTTRNCPPR